MNQTPPIVKDNPSPTVGGDLVQEKTCTKCKAKKPMTEFNKASASQDGRHWQCRECMTDVGRKWLERNRERSRKYSANYRRMHPEAVKRWNDKNSIQKHGITPDQYESIYRRQNGVCAICGEPCISGKRLAIDHDHKTGVVRGLLCTQCNPGLGYFKDDINRLARAIEYLSRHQSDKIKENK